MDDLTLPSRAQAGQAGHVYGIATLFVIQVAQDRFHHFWPRIAFAGIVHLAGNGEIERRIAGEIPAGGAGALGLFRKAGAVSRIVRASKLILTSGDDFVFALFEQQRMKFLTSDLPGFGPEGITANRATVGIEQPPPAPFANLGI